MSSASVAVGIGICEVGDRPIGVGPIDAAVTVVVHAVANFRSIGVDGSIVVVAVNVGCVAVAVVV